MKYGIDWSKVDAENAPRLDAKRPEVTAVTEQGANPSRAKSTRAKREAPASTTAKSTRKPSTLTTVEQPQEDTDIVDRDITVSDEDEVTDKD